MRRIKLRAKPKYLLLQSQDPREFYALSFCRKDIIIIIIIIINVYEKYFRSFIYLFFYSQNLFHVYV